MTNLAPTDQRLIRDRAIRTRSLKLSPLIANEDRLTLWYPKYLCECYIHIDYRNGKKLLDHLHEYVNMNMDRYGKSIMSRSR